MSFAGVLPSGRYMVPEIISFSPSSPLGGITVFQDTFSGASEVPHQLQSSWLVLSIVASDFKILSDDSLVVCEQE